MCASARQLDIAPSPRHGETAGGTAGAAKAPGTFKREVDIPMAQMGATKISDLGPQFLMWKDEEDLRRNRR